jgi:hypothetical protein
MGLTFSTRLLVFTLIKRLIKTGANPFERRTLNSFPGNFLSRIQYGMVANSVKKNLVFDRLGTDQTFD